MVNSNQFVVRPKLQWSLMLTVLFGLCALSAPHLLTYAHAHHTTTGRTSRPGSHSQRSRTGSNSADSEHETESAFFVSAYDPHTPSNAAQLVAMLHTMPLPVAEWSVIGIVAQQDAPYASSLPGTSSRGRAPPLT